MGRVSPEGSVSDVGIAATERYVHAEVKREGVKHFDFLIFTRMPLSDTCEVGTELFHEKEAPS